MSNIVYKALRYCGIAWLWREMVQRNKVTFLLFHDMDAVDAERNFAYLKKHYQIIGLSDYLEAVRLGVKFPKKSVVITLDDGHASNYQMLPVIQRLQIPVTIFLCSSIVGTNRHFWFRHSEEMKSQVEALKQLTNQQRLEAMRQYGFDQRKEFDNTQALTIGQINEMKSVVDFQSHTCFHPILPQCNNEEAQWEIAVSKQQLEYNYGLEICALSYPNGDYSLRDIEMAKKAGYQCGVTVDSGYNDTQTDLFRLKRFSVNDAKSITELMVKASGVYALIKHRLHKPSYGFKKVQA